MDALIEEFGRERVHFFAYDWRLSGEKNTDILESYIDSLLEEVGTDKVSFVTHSTGGLLASSYIARNDGENKNKVDKFVSIATPFLGSPKAAYVFATGDFLPHDFPPLPAIKKLSSHMPGAYQLLPPRWVDEQYIGLATVSGHTFYLKPTYTLTLLDDPYGFIVREMELINANGDVVRGIVKSELLREASEFQRSMFIDGDTSKHILQDMSNVYFITGSSRSTINEIYFDSTGRHVIDIKFTNGDDTVPNWSATNENSFNVRALNANHNGIVGDPLCIGLVLDILKGSFSESPPPSQTKHQIIRIACPVDVIISHNGEILTNVAENFNSMTSWGSLYVVGENNDVKLIALDTNEAVDIKLVGTDTGTMDYSIEYLDEDFNLLTSYSAVGVPITANTKIATSTYNTLPPVLEIDNNGNGVVDEIRPLIEITMAPIVESVIPSAFVTKLNGNINDLTVIVTEHFPNGAINTITKTFVINNNSAETYQVGNYKVYVDTKGNDQIRACYLAG